MNNNSRRYKVSLLQLIRRLLARSSNDKEVKELHDKSLQRAVANLTRMIADDRGQMQ